MKIYDMPQVSEEWFALKAGKMSGTSFATVANGRADTRKKLVLKLAAERMTGQRVTEKYSNVHMERGNELEMEARVSFELEKNITVSECGFIMQNESDGFGISPDGIIYNGDKIVSGVEIKCKDIHTHLDCLLNGWDKTYKWQIQGAMLCTGAPDWWFVSYNPFHKKSLYCELIQRDEELIEKIVKGIADIETAIADILERVK